MERVSLQPWVDLLPNDCLCSLSENCNMLQVVSMALLFVIALCLIPSEQARPLLAFSVSES